MHFVRRAIDLLKQALQIDRSACTSCRDHQFHFCLSVISSEADGEVEKSLNHPYISQRSSTFLDTIEEDPSFINTGLQPSEFCSNAQ
jgi:hypothetical protein